MNTAQTAASASGRRKRLWLLFWVFLIASPFLGLLGPIVVEAFTRRPHSFITFPQLLAYVTITFSGAVIAGRALAQLRNANDSSLPAGLRFGCAICTLYILAGALMVALKM